MEGAKKRKRREIGGREKGRKGGRDERRTWHTVGGASQRQMVFEGHQKLLAA
jgi:hypothetical protein